MGKQPIEAMLRRAETALMKLQKEYQAALHSREITANLRNQIQGYCGELQSALEAIAHEIADKYYPNIANRPAFPVFTEKTDFLSLMNEKYPDLFRKNQRIFYFLENIQPYKRAENLWLAYFTTLTTQAKYDKLIPQSKVKKKRLDAYAQINGKTNWSTRREKAVLDIVTSLPADEVWVAFQFQDIPVSALWLLYESLYRIRQLYKDIRPELIKSPLDLYPFTINEAVYKPHNNFPAYTNGNH